jgi:hypothetical protein
VQGEQGVNGLTYPTYEDLARRSNRNASVIRRVAGKENWTLQRKQFLAKVENLTQEKKSVVMAGESVEFDSICLKSARLGIDELLRRLEGIKTTKAVSKGDLISLSKALKAFQAVGKLAFGENPGDETSSQKLEISVVSEKSKSLTNDVINGKNTE